MSVLDLNIPADFAALTTALGLGGGDPSKWNIVESSFDSVKFHIFSSKPQGAYGGGPSQVNDRGGQRIVAYEFPFKDGQTTATLGAKANGFEFDVVLYGPDYLSAYNRLITAGAKKTPKLLMHPVLGAFLCRLVDYENLHQSDAHQAIRMRLSFVEHTYTLAVSSQANPATQTPLTKSSTLKQALVAAVAVFQAVNAARLKILAYKSAATSVVNGIAAQVDVFKASYGAMLRDLATTFGGAESINFGTDLPGILPVQLGGATVASDTYPLVDQTRTPFAEVPQAETDAEQPIAVAAMQAAQKVNAVRAQAEAIIQALSALNPTDDVPTGEGAIDFYDETVTFKQAAESLQAALELALSSSNAIIATYTVPRLMTIREVAYSVGLTPDDQEQLLTLNPELLSCNFIEAGTELKVPAVA